MAGTPSTGSTISNTIKTGLVAGAVAAATALYQKTGAPAARQAGLNIQAAGGGGLRFPLDLVNDSRQFYMDLQFYAYQRRSIFDRGFLSATTGIQLPVPNNLIDSQSVAYSEISDTTAAVGAAIETGLGPGGGLTTAGGALNTAGAAGLGAVIDKFRSEVNAAAGGGRAADQALQLTGTAVNPFLTVLFQQPVFKSHQFSWKLTPRNAQETEIVKNIIRTVKANMLPSMVPSTGGTLLGYPNMLQVQLYPAEQYLYQFKPCVVENFTVNFAPGNTPAFFKGTNAPVEVHISLQLKEIEYWLAEDFTGGAAAGQFGLGQDFANAVTDLYQNTVNKLTGQSNPQATAPASPVATNGRAAGPV